MYQKTRFSHKYLIISIDIDFIRFCFPFFYIRWLMGYDILSADIARNAHYIRSNTMGIFVAAQVGRSVGEVANPLFDSSFLRSHALLRRLFL